MESRLEDVGASRLDKNGGFDRFVSMAGHGLCISVPSLRVVELVGTLKLLLLFFFLLISIFYCFVGLHGHDNIGLRCCVARLFRSIFSVFLRN